MKSLKALVIRKCEMFKFCEIRIKQKYCAVEFMIINIEERSASYITNKLNLKSPGELKKAWKQQSQVS